MGPGFFRYAVYISVTSNSLLLAV